MFSVTTHFLFYHFFFQNLQQGEQGRNSPNTPTTPSTTSLSRNQNHNTEHLPAMTPPNNHHVANSASHRFHPYNRPDMAASQGSLPAKVDTSRDPRLKFRGNNGIGNSNGNSAGLVVGSSHSNNGTHNTELPARNIINVSRDPRTRR